MKKLFFIGLFFFLTAFGFAQKNKQPRPPAPPVAAKGCDYARDIVRCTSEKIYTAAIKNLPPENIQEIINGTEEDTLKVTIKLRFTSKRNLYLHRSSIRFYDVFKRMEARINSDVPRLPFTIGDKAWLYEGNKYASSYGFRLLIDREKKALLPLYDLDSEIWTKKSKTPDQFMRHPKCEASATYETQNKCFHEEIKKLITANFNSQAAKKAGVSDIVEASILINYDQKGTLEKVRVSNKNPFVIKEIERILQSLPTVKPATIDGTPKGWYGEYKVKFKI